MSLSSTEDTRSLIIQDHFVQDIYFEFLYGQINMKNHAADDVSVVLIKKQKSQRFT